MNVYLDFIYWGILGLINLAVSLLIYHSTKLERKKKFAAEYDISTKRHSSVGPSFPSSFAYLSFFTGILNTGGALLRFRQIYFLEIPVIPWLAEFGDGVETGSELMELLEAKWLIAMNDWTSLFLALTFLLAGCSNFATVRQLRLRDQLVKKVLLPVPISGSQWRGGADEKTVNSLLEQDQSDEEKPALGSIMAGEKGRSFAVFTPLKLCTRRLYG